MAESAESKSIRELTKAVKDSNEKRQAQLERIAASTDHQGTKRAENAREQLKKDEEAMKLRKDILGVSQRRFNKATILGSAISKQKEIMENQKKELEKINKKYG